MKAFFTAFCLLRRARRSDLDSGGKLCWILGIEDGDVGKGMYEVTGYLSVAEFKWIVSCEIKLVCMVAGRGCLCCEA